ncbi:MAG TPA: adenylate/guanylate cyclase domain-containing protein, partial [Arthrobacter sp.]|nr:adenylate/guanylate cyclase domain-containing protein [Arthrobacter sp.]
VRSFLGAGVDIDRIQAALDSGEFTFDFLDRFFPEPAPRTGPAPAELAARLGVPAETVASCYLEMGLPEPSPSQPLRADEAEIVQELLALWGGTGRDALLRAARLVGEPARLVAEGWTRLYVERIADALAGLDTAERIDAIVSTTERATRLAPRMLQWLLFAHLRHAIDQANIEGLEAGLAAQGIAEPRPRQQPAMAFVDLSGYTRMTADHGDDAAVRSSDLLREHALRAVRPSRGRLVKLLGDGAMLYFPDPAGAVRAVRGLVDALSREGLPAHAGIHTGPVVEHDGDYYGSTVNLASRVAGIATAGQVVVTAEVLAAPGLSEVPIEPVGAVPVKGVTAPIDLHRINSGAADLP